MDYQDMLAEIGVASAHPGGPGLTRFWCNKIDFAKVRHVLEVGCGTGRTLSELALSYNITGVGVDVRPQMVSKAKMRAAQLGIHGTEFLVASADELPFEDNTFDLAFTESVNVFLDQPSRALDEYARVLRDGGLYVDVEMLVMQPVDATWREGVKRVYGARFVPDQTGWKKLYKQAGFRDVKVLTTRSVNPMTVQETELDAGGSVNLTTPGAYQNTEVLVAMEANAKWMETNYRPLGYGVFLCQK